MAIKISIITICYNNENDIEKTIMSVLAQSYKNYEYIIIDGNSKDGTMSKIDKYKSKIDMVISEPDKNLYDAINKGIKHATGDVVGLIHAGDRLYDNSIFDSIAKAFNSSELEAIYGNSVLVNEDDIPVRINISPEYSKQKIRNGWMPSHQSIYIRKNNIDKIGLYNTSLHPSSDYEFFLRYFYFNDLKIERLNKFMIRFSIGGRSTKNYINNIKAQKQHKQCWVVNGEKPPLLLVPLKLLRKPRQFILALKYRYLSPHLLKI